MLEAPDTLVAGYRPAWWCCEVDGPLNRHRVSPPHNQFCDASNDCEWGAQYLPDDPEVIGEPAGPCAHRNAAGRYDLKCWYHEPTTWKSDCELTCGNELLRFDPGYPYQEDGTAYPPACDLSGLPAGSRVIDNLPDGTPSVRPDCGRPWVNAGTFNLSYGEFGGEYPGKIDTHQLGMGLGGHFWMANARTATTSEGVQLKVTGRWRFTQAYTGVATVWANLPPLVNGTTQARYTIKTKYGDRVSVVNLRGDTNRWVRLGVFRFDGPPEVTLTTITPDGDGTQRIAFDAVAYTPATSSRTLKVLHWNIAGATINDGDYYVVDRLVQEILARQPDIVSVNEICVNQFDTLRRRLADAGYEMGWGFNSSRPVTSPVSTSMTLGSLWATPCWSGAPWSTSRTTTSRKTRNLSRWTTRTPPRAGAWPASPPASPAPTGTSRRARPIGDRLPGEPGRRNTSARTRPGARPAGAADAVHPRRRHQPRHTADRLGDGPDIRPADRHR